MDFTEKLRRRSLEIGNKSKASRAQGLKPNAISSYVAKASLPRADIALKMARALDVPLEWLVDDEQDWPPPKGDRPAVELLPDDALLEELARRYRLQSLRVLKWFETLKRADWAEVARRLYTYPPGTKLPGELEAVLSIVFNTGTMAVFAPGNFDPRVYAEEHHADMPGRDRPAEELDITRIVNELRVWRNANPHFQLVEEYVRLLGGGDPGAFAKASKRLAEIDGSDVSSRRSRAH
jgi:hypothetical protein